MREYLFRGKRKDKPTEWVYGYYLQFYYEVPHGDYTDSKFGHFILPLKPDGAPPREEDIHYEILPETLGQLMPLKDSIGNRLFEGDIVMGKRTPDNFGRIVSFHKEPYYDYKVVGFEITETFAIFTLPKSISYSERNPENEIKWELCGNVVDNPELLK